GAAVAGSSNDSAFAGPSRPPRPRRELGGHFQSNRGQMAGYRGGICVDLAHERGHMRLFSWLPGGRPGATSGANRVKQRWFSPVDSELRQDFGSGEMEETPRASAQVGLVVLLVPGEAMADRGARRAFLGDVDA